VQLSCVCLCGNRFVYRSVWRCDTAPGCAAAWIELDRIAGCCGCTGTASQCWLMLCSCCLREQWCCWHCIVSCMHNNHTLLMCCWYVLAAFVWCAVSSCAACTGTGWTLCMQAGVHMCQGVALEHCSGQRWMQRAEMWPCHRVACASCRCMLS
jgi:hypothetical protein